MITKLQLDTSYAAVYLNKRRLMHAYGTSKWSVSPTAHAAVIKKDAKCTASAGVPPR